MLVLKSISIYHVINKVIESIRIFFGIVCSRHRNNKSLWVVLLRLGIMFAHRTIYLRSRLAAAKGFFVLRVRMKEHPLNGVLALRSKSVCLQWCWCSDIVSSNFIAAFSFSLQGYWGRTIARELSEGFSVWTRVCKIWVAIFFRWNDEKIFFEYCLHRAKEDLGAQIATECIRWHSHAQK